MAVTVNLRDPGRIDCAQGDLSSLYCSLSGKLEQIVRHDIAAADGVVEDACQFAWTQLTRYRHGVRSESVLAWLARTASHEACRLLRRGARELSLEALLEAAGECALPPAPVGPEETCEARDRLGTVRTVPVRQQRLLWLHAIGLSYAEMAAHEGCTRRTVERQLLRAKDAVRSVATE